MENVIVGLFSVVVSGLLGYFAYRRSVKVDATAAQAGEQTESRAGIEQVIDALNDLNNNLQADNRVLRQTLQNQLTRFDALEADNKECEKKTKHLANRLDAVEMERNILQHTLDRLITKYQGE